MAFLVRPAEIREAPDIAEFHVRIWRETYINTAPVFAYETLDVQHRLPIWEKHLRTLSPLQHTLIALHSNKIIGLVSFGPPTDPVFGTNGEIKHLYVDSKYRGQGLGRRLLLAALNQLGKDGFEAAALAVFRKNENALKFYLANGGKEHGTFIDSGPIWKSENIIITWNNLEKGVVPVRRL
jgi:ribosomal protein S18 acetylase RimI-like enzyme